MKLPAALLRTLEQRHRSPADLTTILRDGSVFREQPNGTHKQLPSIPQIQEAAHTVDDDDPFPRDPDDRR